MDWTDTGLSALWVETEERCALDQLRYCASLDRWYIWREGRWQVAGQATYRVNGNGLELSLARDLANETGGDPAFDFHWSDNIQSFGAVAELGINGDSAPNRRWNYRFERSR